MKRKKNPPHRDVYTRLKLSSIPEVCKEWGVGVFAIRDIPKGVNIFKGDKSEWFPVRKSDVEKENSEIKKLYHDFCVLKGDLYYCPDNFNNLTVAWYLNDSKENPNVRCDEDYDFYALRDIKKGEELTVDYSTYSDNELM